MIKDKQTPDARGAIEREFNLPLPGGKTIGRQADVLEAMAPFI